jgi:carboxypeptidase Taq
MFYEKALETYPGIPSDLEDGQFDTLRRWLTENIYWSGWKYTAPELIERVTGKPDLDAQPLIRYFRSKYGEIYTL